MHARTIDSGDIGADEFTTADFVGGAVLSGTDATMSASGGPIDTATGTFAGTDATMSASGDVTVTAIGTFAGTDATLVAVGTLGDPSIVIAGVGTFAGTDAVYERQPH